MEEFHVRNAKSSKHLIGFIADLGRPTNARNQLVGFNPCRRKICHWPNRTGKNPNGSIFTLVLVDAYSERHWLLGFHTMKVVRVKYINNALNCRLLLATSCVAAPRLGEALR